MLSARAVPATVPNLSQKKGFLWSGRRSLQQFSRACIYLFVLSPLQHNHLVVGDVNTVARNRRRTHLVRTSHGLFWIVLTRVSRGRIRAGVFAVEQRATGGAQHQNRVPSPSLAYRVTTVSAEGQARSRSRIRRVAWTSSLKDDDRGDGGGLDDTYTAIRSRGGSVEFSWWFEPSRRNATTTGRCVAPWSATAVTATTAAASDHQSTYE